tara:strand:+ start:14810 stop:16507 length:1698 start_codon:yes stop_codon:yes gene_type:complete
MAQDFNFRKPKTIQDLVVFLGIDQARFEAAISAGQMPSDDDSIYFRHRIPKKNKTKGYRTVWDVLDSDIRDAHRAFARRFANFAANAEPAFPHNSAYGYVRGRGIRDNAARHCGRQFLLRCDIRDFFPSITRYRLENLFKILGVRATVADLLSKFATIEDKLALGLNASPMLANLTCLALDQKLTDLAITHDCMYTRYADDISISGEDLPNFVEVVDILHGEGFSLSQDKTRVTRNGQAHFVTGLSISDPDCPHVPRRFKRRLRQELYYIQKHGILDHLQRDTKEPYQTGINRIDGTVRYVASIESKLAPRLREQWNECLASEPARVSYAPRHDASSVKVAFLVDEAQFCADGHEYLALACVTTERLCSVRTAIKDHLQEHLMDPFSAGKKKNLERKGLHWSDAPEDLRTSFSKLLTTLPFRAYIAFGTFDRDGDYESLYLKLLNSLLPRRLKGFDRAHVDIIFEENSHVSRKGLTDSVEMLYRRLTQADDRRPLTKPEVTISPKKHEPAFSVPDALLGVFCRYFSKSEVEKLSTHRFERLRDKYRHIANVDNGQIFSRRHPFER